VREDISDPIILHMHPANMMIFVQALILALLVQGNVPSASLSAGFQSSATKLKSIAGFRQPLSRADLLSRDRTVLYTANSVSELPAIKKGGDATISTSIFNLAKSVIGAGVLSLPSGVAFFADESSALLPSSIICAVFGLIAAYSFSSIGNICKDYDADSFQDAWAKSVSPKSAWIISSSITAMCFLASLAYSIIIGDSFTSLAKVQYRLFSLLYCLLLFTH
jgi:hypothetical protein